MLVRTIALLALLGPLRALARPSPSPDADFSLDDILSQFSLLDEEAPERPYKCGKVDVPTRSKRFVTDEHKWLKNDIGWKFRDPHGLFSKETDFEMVRKTITRALEMWSLASRRSLVFRDLSNSSSEVVPDLDIFFARWDHGDHEPFDGRGGIVAHSGYPMEGKVHFDASELWTINGQRGIDLRYVTLHELGHALGLRHSEKKGAIMHPIYSSPYKRLALSVDDIRGIRHLYHRSHRHHHHQTSPIR